MESQNYDYLKNFGITNNIFNLQSSNSDIYVIRQEKIKKNFSEGAIYKIHGSLGQICHQKPKDDMEIYDECDQEYSVLGTNGQEKTKIFSFCGNNSSFMNMHTNKSNFSVCNQNEFYFNDKNLIPKNQSNSSIFSNFSTNIACGKDNKTGHFPENSEKNLLSLTFLKNENCENNQNNFTNGSICKITNNKLNDDLDESKSLDNQSQKLKDDVDQENNKNIQEEISKIDEKSHQNPPTEENCLENGIFKDYMQNQMNQLDRIFKEMNESKEAKVIIKAYKSKLKTKFYKIYESNSEFFKERNKYKIFHKCNFPGCARTFASAGWLKSHFNEHLHELKLNKFNLEFEKNLGKCKQLNLF